MSRTILYINGITKTYKKHVVLNNMKIHVNKGDIYGFIGENGAGKTTTIKIIAGLIPDYKGEISLFERTDKQGLMDRRNKIGCIIEAPAIYPEMTAAQNLEVQRIQRNLKDKDCVKRTLKLVGLEDTGKKKSRDFSLGMRQRLGLAAALIADPEFLILDEPTNGLDPEGIMDLRVLMKKLNQEYGITIMISSHILTELHQVATCYGIIHKGVMLEELSHEEMDNKCSQKISVSLTDEHMVETVINEKLKCGYQRTENNQFVLNLSPERINEVAHLFHAHDIRIKEIQKCGDTLESYFKTLVGE